MKEFISKWSNWWILNSKRKQLDDAFEKELNELQSKRLKAFADYAQKKMWQDGDKDLYNFVDEFLNL